MAGIASEGGGHARPRMPFTRSLSVIKIPAGLVVVERDTTVYALLLFAVQISVFVDADIRCRQVYVCCVSVVFRSSILGYAA